jgi:hypothetical protein
MERLIETDRESTGRTEVDRDNKRKPVVFLIVSQHKGPIVTAKDSL